MDGIFQGICQDNRKLSFVYREGVGQGNICLHRDILILRLVKIGGKHSIQNRRTAPSDQFVFIQPSLGGLQEVQGGFFFPPGYHLHHSLDAMAQVMALPPPDGELFLRRYVYGETAAQLGVHFNMPAATVRTRLHRARLALQKLLKEG